MIDLRRFSHWNLLATISLAASDSDQQRGIVPEDVVQARPPAGHSLAGQGKA